MVQVNHLRSQDPNRVSNVWTLGGLSLSALLKRTWRESWQDAVFGQAGRMAFYHFLGIFPSLFIFLTVASHSSSIAEHMSRAVSAVGGEFLPHQVASLIQQSISELNHRVVGWELLSAVAGALWASLNATWALIYGLNTAYEVKEERHWWKLACTIAGLTVFLALWFWTAFALFLLAAWLKVRILPVASSHAATVILLRGVEWVAVLALVLFALAVVYRFAPNLRDRKWSWSTPGALCAIILWVIASLAIRLYFEHVSDRAQTYGSLNSVVMLLLWLYFSNAAILIGGEMNSEIEKAAAKSDGAQRSGA